MTTEGLEGGARGTEDRALRIVVNGIGRDVPRDATVAALMTDLDIAAEPRGVAIALDGIVVPRALWETTALFEGATVEVVRASAGG